MRQLASLFHRFGRDERGAFAVIFAMMAIVLVALSGAVVDYVTLEQTRNRAQIALDAATLALQPEIFKTPLKIDDIKKRAEDLVLDRLGTDPAFSASLFPPVVDVTNGTLTLEARLTIKTMFVSLVGVSELNARVKSQATRRMLDVEVSMVLDNSGSMGGTRMSNLKTAACNAVNILFYDKDGLGCVVPTGVTKNTNVKIAVVPFTSLVNIGTDDPNAAWLDWTGESHLAGLGYIPNFDNDDDESTLFQGPMDRRTLFSQTKSSWQGCIEARIAPYDTTDDAPDSAIRKFVPLFTPDTVYRGWDSNYTSNNSYMADTGGSCTVKTCTQEKSQSSCYNNWGGWSCYGGTTYKYTKKIGSVTTNEGTTSCLPADPVTLSAPTYSYGSTTKTTTVFSLLSERELQDRMCKYNGTTTISSNNTNYLCPTAKLLPLTNSPSTILARINAMVADGNTNIQQGTVWGMHALTSGAPLTEAKAQAPGQVSKVLIVMTDGKNEPALINNSSDMNGSVYYSWGFRYDGRLGPKSSVTGSQVTTVMDERTVLACEYARNNRDIDVYTIGLGASTATKAMLTSCASDADHAYFPDNASDLNGVFRAIAAELAALRLSQ